MGKPKRFSDVKPEIERLERKIRVAQRHPQTPEVQAAIARHKATINAHLRKVQPVPLPPLRWMGLFVD